MAKGLAISDVVNVSVNLSPLAAAYRDFGALLILGSTPGVIDQTERLRAYSSLNGVAADFGTTAPEYLAANLFFSQSPKPNFCFVGRWLQTAAAGLLKGAVLSFSQQLLSNFTAITTGSMVISINGSAQTLTALNFSTAGNLNAVASLVTAKLTGGATCLWDSVQQRFSIVSGTTGTSSLVGYATIGGGGADVSAILGLSAAAGASAPVPGATAETLLQGVTTLADVSGEWYGLTLAPTTNPSDSDYVAAAAFIEGAGKSRVFGITTQAPNTLDSASNSDLASLLKAAAGKRTFIQYSSSSPYAAASTFGRAFTVDFEANNTTITLKFKTEPGVTAENITETQAQTLKAKNCNVYVAYDNARAILQEGVMSNGYFFDEVHGTDWLQNAIQTDVFNLLYQSNTKVPQTDAGMHLIVTAVESACSRAVRNGLCAPGVWNAGGFGQLAQGDTLTKGFYVYCPQVATQSQADRETRKTPPIQVAAKLAGAVHSSNILINVNR
jgi:hypothetical protein